MDLSDLNRQKVLIRWNNLHKKQSEKINFNRLMMARLCGFLAGDGSVKIRTEKSGKVHHTLEFFPDDISILKSFVEAFEKIYSKIPVVEKHKNYFRLRVYSKVIVNHILNYSDFGLFFWSVPTSLLTDLDSKREWLRAYFDAEGYVGKNHIKVQSVNQLGILGVHRLLLDFGIASKLFEYQPKQKNWNKVYILQILKKEDRIKFSTYIGFNHKKKLNKLLSILGNNK